MLEKIRQDISGLSFTSQKADSTKTITGIDLYNEYGQNVQSLFKLLARIDRVNIDLNNIKDLYSQRDSSDKISYFLTLVQDFRLLLIEMQRLPDQSVLSNFQPERTLRLADETLELAQYTMQKQPGLAINQLLVLMDSLKLSPTSDVYKFVEKYGPFIATLSEAKSGEEVAAALESAAAPVGSFRVKHNYRQNVCVQAYVGVSGGQEYLYMNNAWQGNFVTAFTAPIGVAWSFTRFKNTAIINCATLPIPYSCPCWILAQ